MLGTMTIKSVLLLVLCSGAVDGTRATAGSNPRPSRIQRCPPTMEYKRCSSACGSSTLTCEQYYQGKTSPGMEPCKNRRCGPPRCECPSKTVMGPDKLCILPEECPNVPDVQVPLELLPPSIQKGLAKIFMKPKEECPPTMVMNKCPSECKSGPSSCDEYLKQKDSVNQNQQSLKVCVASCGPPKCECPKSQVTGPDGLCISTELCLAPAEQVKLNLEATTSGPETPPLCPSNMIMNECSSSCKSEPGSCEEVFKYKDPAYRKKKAGRKCSDLCIPMCECPKGQVLGPTGLCILREKCPAPNQQIKVPSRTVTDPPCPSNMVWRACSTLCEQTCESFRLHKPCFDGCGVPRCQCPGGKVLSLTGNCIRPDHCPK